MKKNIISIMISVMMATMILTGCGNSEKKECECVLEEFQDACNNVDVNSILECIDPNVADPIRLLIAATGEDVNEYLNMISDSIMYEMNADGMDADQILASITIEPEDIEFDEKTAVAYCRVSCEVNGEEMVRFADIEMKNHDDEWYITYFMVVDER